MADPSGAIGPATLSERAADSPWVAAGDGLAESIAALEREVGDDRDFLVEEANDLARPGFVRPVRALRHVTLNTLSGGLRLGLSLPADLLSGAPMNDPVRWARRNAVALFADQLASGGAPAAEISRLILDAGDLFPGEVTAELAQRDIEAPRLTPDAIRRVALGAFPHLDHVEERPVASTAVSQLHHARLPSGEHAFVRVRRPGVARDLRDDARFTALRIAALERLLPQIGGMSPATFVALTNRQLLEASDLRYEGLNAVELGLVAESLGLDALSVARPVAGGATARALLLEPVGGESLALGRALPDDPTAALQALVGITLESAVSQGVFWADPSASHLLVTPDGGLAVVGVGTLGRLSPTMRRAGSTFLRSLLSGDAEGQVEAMRLAEAIPPDADVDGLIADLTASDAMQVSTILMGGQAGLMGALNEAIRLLLAHRLAPPLEVILLVRTLFSLGHLSRTLLPGEDGLLMALMPLVARLPELLADEPNDG